MKHGLSSFSTLLIFLCLSIIGASLVSRLSVQLTPSRVNKTIGVYYDWQGSSAKIMEQEVTSILEGVLYGITGIKSIRSTSRKGSGSITLNFKDRTDMDVARFEVASMIRQVYDELPESVSYPRISKSNPNESVQPLLSYSIHADESPYYIQKYTLNHIIPKLTVVEGVNNVNVYGGTPYQWVMTYNSDKLLQFGVSANEIQKAINTYLTEEDLGLGMWLSDVSQSDDKLVALTLGSKQDDRTFDWPEIPIKKVQGHIIYLKDLANNAYKEGQVSGYFRINGLNSINLVIYAEKSANRVKLGKDVESHVNKIRGELPSGYSMKIALDHTKFIKEEISRIQKRAILSLLILFLIIALINRSLKYLLVLFLGIIANLLIAVIFYYLLGVDLQLYSFAGITISFGIIIDNSIIMIDHIRSKGNKKAFLGLLAATLTTIGALVVIFFLKEQQRLDLWDFALVIVINLGVSLLTAFYCIPALLEIFNLNRKNTNFSRKRKQYTVRFTNGYINVMTMLRKPIARWLMIMLFVIGFGLPIHLLPKTLDGDGLWEKTYNMTLGSEWFYVKVRPTLEKIIGGSLRLFIEEVFERSYYQDLERTSLEVSGSMPDGCTIEQMNETILKFENYISQFEEVDIFETQIDSHKSASIRIYFKKEEEFGAFPHILNRQLQSKAISLGGLDWTVMGVGRGFSNAVGSGYKRENIELEGYNYDVLYSYAEVLKDNLENIYGKRIEDAEISANRWSSSLNEYYLEFDEEKLALANVSQTDLYQFLKNQVRSNSIGSIIYDQELQRLRLESNQYGKFNVWDLKNTPLIINDGEYKLGELASVEKRKMGNEIKKHNQQYRLMLIYNFLGTFEMAESARKRVIEELEPNLPIGYRILKNRYMQWDRKDSRQYYFVFVVILIIFFICSILLESLKQPLAIISMIPISFIGVFLTFYIFGFNFDQGGYASFILLCGISVNAALYIVNDYNNLKKSHPGRDNRLLYFKAFNYKIIPITLTIVSTIVGLIPFMWNGQEVPFWFAFAVGSIGGLVFSLVGILVYLPLFVISKRK